MMRQVYVLLILAVSASFSAHAQKTIITVDAAKPVAEIQPTMWGIFFEDINYAADGGIYAELVKNRSFEFSSPLMGWTVDKYNRYSNNKESGSISVLNTSGSSANHRYARIAISGAGLKLSNEGFFGMGFKKDLRYNFSFAARSVDADHVITAELLNEKDEVIGTTTLNVSAKEWKKYEASLVPTETCAKGKLRLSFSAKGTVDIDLVSLMPTDTWKNTALRSDIVQLLYDLKPGFLRFPGGCIVEGRDLATRYQWKKTVGSRDTRELLINRWNTEFAHRPSPDYYQSFGLGFFEYFTLAEDIGASPLPILSCGMACQFNTAEVVPLDEIDPYIQDALDLIEFANGDTNTKWGKLRADMGHAEPFHLKMIGVGNEQWGSEYIERYQLFAPAIKAKYPDIKIVSGAGPFPDGELFDYAATELKKLKADLVDEHYYHKPEWFLQNAKRYDQYDRSGPKIFAGEYAAQSESTTSPKNRNTWQCALAEAAFMTGLERNADVVYLASYAPLLAHAEGWQWTPDLIWFDNLRAYATPNYYVQRLFSNNKGTHTLRVTLAGENVTGQNGLYASAVLDAKTKEVIFKIVNASAEKRSLQVQINGVKLAAKGTMTMLVGELEEENTLGKEPGLVPAEIPITVKGKTLPLELPANSFSVWRVKGM
jgi:alpha-N-arabinofuranosidase